MRVAIAKRSVRETALGVFFLFSFGLLKNFPNMAIFYEGWMVINFIFLLTFYAADRARRGFKITRFEGYILILMLWVPICSAIQSYREFSQPFIYGLLAQRGIFLAASALILLYFLRQRKIELQDIEQALVKLTWACLIIFSLLALLLDPLQFAEHGPGFVVGVNINEAAFKFNATLIVFGLFYYLFKAYWLRSFKLLFLATPFFLYLLFIEGGRSLLVSIIVTLIFFVYRWSSFGRLVKVVPKILVYITVLFIVIASFSQNFLDTLALKYADAFTVVLKGEDTSDVSANARLNETMKITPYIENHWAFGNGHLSQQWEGGYVKYFGRFYPSDIGILGAIFLYGIFGMLLFCIQFIFAINNARHLPKYKIENENLISTTKGFLFFLAINSITTGSFIFSVWIGLQFIVILYWASFNAKVSKSSQVANTFLKVAVK